MVYDITQFLFGMRKGSVNGGGSDGGIERSVGEPCG